MKPSDVILRGEEKDKAFEQLQSSVGEELTLSMDEDGLVTYTQNDPDAELSEEAKQLTTAIDDHSVKVELLANTKETNFMGSEVVGGMYLGAKNVVAGDGEKVTVAGQQLNTDHSEKIDNYFETPGATVLHEVTEAYHGAKLVQKTGIDVTDTGSLLGRKAYNIAHRKATSPPPITVTGYDFDGNVVTNGIGVYRVEYSLQSPGKPKEILKTRTFK